MTVELCVAIDLAQLTMNFDRRYALCIQKLYCKLHFTVRRCWNKILHLQLLQQCYCDNSGSPTSVCVMRCHYSITYTQSLHTIIGLVAVGRVGNLLCGRPSYLNTWEFRTMLYIYYNKLICDFGNIAASLSQIF